MQILYESLLSVWDLDRPDCLFHARAVVSGVMGKRRGKVAADRRRGRLYGIQQLKNADHSEFYLAESAGFGPILRNAFLGTDSVFGVDIWLHALPDTVGTITRIINDPTTYRGFPFTPQINLVTFGH